MRGLGDPTLPVIDVPIVNVVSDSQLTTDTNAMLATNDAAAWADWLKPPKLFILIGIGCAALYLMRKR